MKVNQYYIYRFDIPLKYDEEKYISGYSQVCDARMTTVYAIQNKKDNTWQYDKSSGIKKVNIIQRSDKLTFYFYSDKYYSEGLIFQGRFEDGLAATDRFCSNFRYFPSESVNFQGWKLKEIWR